MLFFRLSGLFIPALICAACTESPAPAVQNGVIGPEDSLAYQTLLEEDAAFRLNQRGDSLRSASRYQEAMACYLMAMDSALVHADSFPYYDAKLDLATIYDRLKEIPTAIELAKDVVAAYQRSGDTLRIGRAYNTLAGFYGKAGRTQENLEAARKGFAILKNHPSLVHRCAAYNQMAFTFSDAGNWNEARPLLDTALSFLLQSDQPDLLPGLYLNLGDCHRNLQHWEQADTYLLTSVQLADSLGQPHIKSRALERLSQVAEARNRPAHALALYRQSKTILDSIFTEDKTRSRQALEITYQTRQMQDSLQLLAAEKKSEQVQKYLIATVSMTGFLIALALFLYRRRQFRWKMKELRQNTEYLQNLAQVLVEKNTRIKELENLIAHPQEMPRFAVAEQDDNADALASDWYGLRILTEQDWTTFKDIFTKTHPKFLYKIRTLYPNITSAEERLFLLIKLNFGRQELADTLGISPESVKKARQRLRKKLGIQPHEGLEAFIQSIE